MRAVSQRLLQPCSRVAVLRDVLWYKKTPFQGQDMGPVGFEPTTDRL